MIKAIRLAVVMILFCGSCFAQRQLVLYHYKAHGAPKRVTFDENRLFYYKLKTDKKFQAGVLMGMNDTALMIYNQIVPLHKIAAVMDRRDRRWAVFFTKLFQTAGIAFFSIDTFNNLTNADQPYIKPQTAMISGALVAAGCLFWPLEARRYRIGKKNKLQTILFEPTPPASNP